MNYLYPQLTNISIVVRNLESDWLEYLRGVDDKPPLGTPGKMPMRNQTPATVGLCSRNNGIASTAAIERVMI